MVCSFQFSVSSVQHGVIERNNIAKVLLRKGYQASMIGKWHLKREPSGFDHYCVLPGQGRYWNPVMKTRDNWQDNNRGGKAYPGFSTDVIADMTIDWIEHRDKTKPFFAMCHFKATHEPFVIRYPKEIPAGTRNRDIIENVDFSAL